MAGVRKFEFEVGVSRPAAIRTMVAALDDEGLTLTSSDNTRGSDINLVIMGGRAILIVPGYRIIRKEQVA